jgi:hypothetical protein
MVKKISIIGTGQTGSTRLFNLTRLLFENENKKVFSCWDYKHDQDDKYDVIVNKIHDCDLKSLKKYKVLLLPIRDVRDAAISQKKRWPNTKIIKSCLNNIHLFNKFKKISDFIFVYEKYDLEYIKKLCRILKVNPDNKDIQRIMNELELMHQSKDIVQYDDHNNTLYKKTLLCQHHNTSEGQIQKYKTELNKNMKNRILNNRIIFSFLKEMKYLENKKVGKMCKPVK